MQKLTDGYMKKIESIQKQKEKVFSLFTFTWCATFPSGQAFSSIVGDQTLVGPLTGQCLFTNPTVGWWKGILVHYMDTPFNLLTL